MSDSEKEDVYEVEDLLDYKQNDGKDFYLVKWKGYNENTWEPDGNIGEELADLKLAARSKAVPRARSSQNPVEVRDKGKKKEKKAKRAKKGKSERKRRRQESSETSSGLSSEGRTKSKKRRKGESDQHAAAWQQQMMHQHMMQQQVMHQWQQQQAVQYQQQMQQWQYAQQMQAQAQYQQQQAAHHHHMLMQQEEEKKRMEDMRKKEEEDKKRREEEAKRKAAQAAIMQVTQKMREATPETFDELKKELDEVFARELKFTGTPLQQLIYEKEKSLEAARKNVEKIKIQRKIAQQAQILEKASAFVKAPPPPVQNEFFKSRPPAPPPVLVPVQAATAGPSNTS